MKQLEAAGKPKRENDDIELMNRRVGDMCANPLKYLVEPLGGDNHATILRSTMTTARRSSNDG